MKIVMIGKPGSGKGTQIEMLQKEFNYHVISTGELLREQIRKKTKIGKQVSKIIQKGDLVPDEISLHLVMKKIGKKRNIIFDGIPRTLYQANEFDKILKIDKVIQITSKDSEIVNRISNRWSCKCGQVYNLLTNPPKKGVCDKCGGKLYQRKDDNVKSIKERLKVFNAQTRPLVNYYKKQKKLIEINGSRPILSIYEDIKKLF